MKTTLKFGIAFLLISVFGCANGAVILPALHHKNKVYPAEMAKLDSVTQLLRLKLVIDEYNYDDIAIGFNSGASSLYNPFEDSAYFPGIDAPEGLASYSSDGKALSVNLLTLPSQKPDIIRLDVEAKNSGILNLSRTRLDFIPLCYQILLVDKYKNTSVNLRTSANYFFTVNKSDTASFGSYRFQVVIIKTNTANLTGFTTVEQPLGTQIAWSAENEGDSTNFVLEKSVDSGITFKSLDSIQSNASGAYTYLDKVTAPGTYLYRLKVIDVYNETTYSTAATVTYQNTGNALAAGINIYPNPVDYNINLTINQNTENTSPGEMADKTVYFGGAGSNAFSGYNIQITNINGLIVKSARSAASSWQENLSTLLPGTYIVQVSSTNGKGLIGRRSFVKL
jgi:hypothetical protein